jgi:hypothetical protein
MGFFDSLFPDPAKKAMPYLQQIPGQAGGYYDPYIQSGGRANKSLEDQYNDLLSDPTGKLNKFGENFQQSPGFQFALQQALEAGNHAAAAGGMAGTPAHEQQNMGIATQLGNQEYYNALDRAMKLYGMGMEGENQSAERGLRGATSKSDLIAQALAQQGQLAHAGQASQNASTGGLISDVIGGAGSFFGSPFGQKALNKIFFK